MFPFELLPSVAELISKITEKRITVNPKQCRGRPCVRGMRIRVSDVLDLFASGLSATQIGEELPDLEAEDLYWASPRIVDSGIKLIESKTYEQIPQTVQ